MSLSHAEGEATSFIASRGERPVTIHVILQVEDNGSPGLFAYRRAVVTASPAGQ